MKHNKIYSPGKSIQNRNDRYNTEKNQKQNRTEQQENQASQQVTLTHYSHKTQNSSNIQEIKYKIVYKTNNTIRKLLNLNNNLYKMVTKKKPYYTN